MSSWSQSAPESGTSNTVKAAVGLTLLTIVLAVVEAIVVVYVQRADTTTDPESLRYAKIAYGSLIGANLFLSAGLAGGAVLTLRRSVAGKALIWVFGSLFALMRCSCGGVAGIFLYMYTGGGEPNDSPLSVGMWGALTAIEVITLIMMLVAMILLVTKAASFKDPEPPYPGGRPTGPTGPTSGYGGPPGPPPGEGLPNLPPTPGWPT